MSKESISLNQKTILITGAAGFIGAALTQRILATCVGACVIGLDNLNDYYDPKLKEHRLFENERTQASGKCSYKFESQPVINSNLNIIQGDPVQIIVDSEDYSNYKILLERSDGLNDKKKDADKSTESTRNQSKYVVSFVLCMLVILFQSISMCIAVSLHGMKEIMGYLPLILIWLFLAFEMKKKNL